MRLLSNLSFQGTGVALVTPFQKNGVIDFNALEKVIRHILEGKCEYIVPLGTTGESATLNKNEKLSILEFVIERVNKKIPVVLGLGGNNTNELLEGFKEYNFKGVDAVLSVSPYYNKPSQQGIYEHYKLIAKASPVPVILYNVPSRTGSNITADTTLRLANDFKNIIGIKEASGNMEQCMSIIKNRPADFLVISGDDSLTLPLMGTGADGVISVVANAYPKIFSEMVRKALKGNFVEARKLHYQLLDVIPMLFTEGSPPGIKAILNAMNLCDENVRLPLVPVSKNLRKALVDFNNNLK
jgi:4-hydroxy-tetrahydrodipicolinate synthase